MLNKTAFAASVFALCCCGAPDQRIEPIDHAQRPIFNGQPTTGHPSVGVLRTPAGLNADGHELSDLCTATLVGPSTVLTAAHCVEHHTAMPTFELDSGEVVVASAVLIHPGYVTLDNSYLHYAADVAVVRLSRPVSGVKPSAIADTMPTIGEAATLVGFGQPNSATPTFGDKRVAQNAISAFYDEGPAYAIDATKGTGSGFCNGDSGGPTFATRGGVELLIGVHSSNVTNGEGGITDPCKHLSMDMRVDAFYGWIAEQAGADLARPGPADVTPPLVTFSYPPDNATVGVPLAVIVEASDDSGEVTEVELRVDGVSHRTLDAPPYHFVLAELTPGPHTLTAVAHDKAGNEGLASQALTIGVGVASGAGAASGVGAADGGGCSLAGEDERPLEPSWLLLVLLGLAAAIKNRRST